MKIIKDIKFWIGIAISGVLLYSLFGKNIDWHEAILAIKQTNVPLVIVNMGLVILSMYIRAIRWRYLLYEVKKIQINSLFSSTMIGFMANNLLPLRMGEIIRAYSLGKKEDIKVSTSFGSVVMERVFDGFTLMTFFALSMLLVPTENVVFKVSGYTVITFYTLSIVFLILLYFKQSLILNFLSKLLWLLPERIRTKTFNIIELFSDGLHVLKNVKHLCFVAGLSILVWLSVAVGAFLMIEAFPFETELPAYTAIVIVAAVALGITVPAAPGHVGTFHLACVLGLNLCAAGISESLAKSFSLLWHLSHFIPITAVGLIFLWKDKMTLLPSKLKEKESFSEQMGS